MCHPDSSSINFFDTIHNKTYIIHQLKAEDIANQNVLEVDRGQAVCVFPNSLLSLIASRRFVNKAVIAFRNLKTGATLMASLDCSSKIEDILNSTYNYMGANNQDISMYLDSTNPVLTKQQQQMQLRIMKWVQAQSIKMASCTLNTRYSGQSFVVDPVSGRVLIDDLTQANILTSRDYQALIKFVHNTDAILKQHNLACYPATLSAVNIKIITDERLN